jgi:hypothetical protein
MSDRQKGGGVAGAPVGGKYALAHGPECGGGGVAGVGAPLSFF